MSDRELLKLAAKAAGIDFITSGGQLWTTLEGSINKHTERWNPLANDGQALRLAVKLRLDVEWLDSETVFVSEAQHVANGDPYAETRRAIVRAAAEIGRSMK